jgi:hypothetical protein
MEDNDNLDRFLERMANRKQKLNPANKPKDFKEHKNRPEEEPRSNNHPIRKDGQKNYPPKEGSKPEGQKKYIAKDTLKKN